MGEFGGPLVLRMPYKRGGVCAEEQKLARATQYKPPTNRNGTRAGINTLFKRRSSEPIRALFLYSRIPRGTPRLAATTARCISGAGMHSTVFWTITRRRTGTSRGVCGFTSSGRTGNDPCPSVAYWHMTEWSSEMRVLGLLLLSGKAELMHPVVDARERSNGRAV